MFALLSRIHPLVSDFFINNIHRFFSLLNLLLALGIIVLSQFEMCMQLSIFQISAPFLLCFKYQTSPLPFYLKTQRFHYLLNPFIRPPGSIQFRRRVPMCAKILSQLLSRSMILRSRTSCGQSGQFIPSCLGSV